MEVRVLPGPPSPNSVKLEEATHSLGATPLMASRTQVKLQLTENPEVLSALRQVGAMRKAGSKDEHLAIQYDAAEFKFFHGIEIVVPAEVAEGLYRGSGVLIGDSVNGTQQPGVEIIEKWELGQQEPSRKFSKTTCSVCGEDQGTVKALIAHLQTHEEAEETEVAPEVK